MSEQGTTFLSIEQVKQGMRATWMAGDFGVIARTIATVRRPLQNGSHYRRDHACLTSPRALATWLYPLPQPVA